MKYFPFLFSILILAGCNSSEVRDVPNPNRVERKPFEQMTQEEKIKFIEMTPMPQDAKAREIQRIKEGRL